MIAHIVAAAKNGVIGTADNDLPWSIPEDMKFFRDTTKGHAMIMGRKTWESVGHPLPNRLNVIVTRQEGYQAEGGVVVNSLEEALKVCEKEQSNWGETIFIIGGGEIFKQSVDLVDTIFLTRIHEDFEGTSHYPDVDLNKFEQTQRSDREDPVPFSFLTYKRR